MATDVLAWPFVARGGQLEEMAAALTEPSVDVLHIAGSPGVGKTRLASQVLAWAESDGFPVAVVRATRSAASVPLSALTPLLPAHIEFTAPASVFAEAAEHVHRLGDGSRVVVLVDDVDQLDTVSLALLARLLSQHLVVLVTTQQDEVPPPDIVSKALRSGQGRRFDLEPLPRSSVGTVLHLALEGPASAPVEQALWSLSGGNPLYLRELVHAGIHSGALVRSGDVWSLVGTLEPSGGLADIVRQRLGDLDEERRSVIELLAVCGPTGVSDLEALAGLRAVEALEAAGVIEVDVVGRRHRASLAHPIYTHVLRDGLPTLRRRRLLLSQVDRVERYAARRRGDALDLAQWRLDATGTADVALLLEAAGLARYAHDYTQVERLARAVTLLEPDVRAAALLGEALYELGRPEEAEAVLVAAMRIAEPADLTALVVPRSLTLFLGLGRFEEAVTCLEDAERIVPPEDAPEVIAMRALLLTQGGRSAAAEAVLESLPDDAAGAAQEVGQRATSWVRLRRGRPQSAAELALADWEESQGTAEAQVLHPSGHLMVAALGLLESGDLSRAETVAADGAAAAMTQGVEFQAGWLRWVSGTVALTAGRLDVAARRFAEVTASARTAGFASVIRLGLAGGLEVAAQRGDLELVRTLSDELAATRAPAELYSAHVSAALGWGEVARGSVPAAVLRWAEASEVLTAAGERVASALVLHAAVRVGDRAAAATLVDVLADIEGPLARAREQHGQGVALQDADALAAAGDSFESLGVDLVAAECLSLASALVADSGSSRQAARLAARADVLLARCGGAATPALRAVTPLSDLTARELEIVQRAAAGRTSRQIAEDLVLSVRTVDNHLQSAYTKLGVTGRDQLAALLAPRSTDRIGQGDPS